MGHNSKNRILAWVLAASMTLGSFPAPALAGEQTTEAPVLMTASADAEAEAARIAAEEAAKMKCFTMLEQVTDQMEREGALPKLLQDGNADGVIVLGVLAEDYLEKLRRQNS